MGYWRESIHFLEDFFVHLLEFEIRTISLVIWIFSTLTHAAASSSPMRRHHLLLLAPQPVAPPPSSLMRCHRRLLLPVLRPPCRPYSPCSARRATFPRRAPSAKEEGTHLAGEETLFNFSILVFSTFYASNFNISFLQFQHFEVKC